VEVLKLKKPLESQSDRGSSAFTTSFYNRQLPCDPPRRGPRRRRPGRRLGYGSAHRSVEKRNEGRLRCEL